MSGVTNKNHRKSIKYHPVIRRLTETRKERRAFRSFEDLAQKLRGVSADVARWAQLSGASSCPGHPSP